MTDNEIRAAKQAIIGENCDRPVMDLAVAHWLSAQVVAGEQDDARAKFMMEAFSLTCQLLFCSMTACCPEMLNLDKESVGRFLSNTLGDSVERHLDTGTCDSMVRRLDEAIRKVEQLTPQADK